MKLVLILILSASFSVFAAPAKKAKKGEGESKKNFSFDDQLVEGEVYRPDYSVVTGEAPGEGWGVLRMRPTFADHSTTDAEEKKP
jgi:hypothetical protein